MSYEVTPSRGGMDLPDGEDFAAVCGPGGHAQNLMVEDRLQRRTRYAYW